MLTEHKIKTAESAGHPYKLYDSEGMFLLVGPSGSKWWRFKYRYAGKEKLLSLGVFPDVPLLTARRLRDAARRQLAEGIDPSAARQEAKSALHSTHGNTFGIIATEWLERREIVMGAETFSRANQILDDYVLPMIGRKPVSMITAPDVLSILKPLEAAGKYHTVMRTKHRIGQILRYASATGRGGRDVTEDLRGILINPPQQHHPAITSPTELGPFLRAIDTYPGSPFVRSALLLQSLVFVRPGELVPMEWQDIDLDNQLWSVPAVRMKMKRDHIVPLSKQATTMLRCLKPITGQYSHVLPNVRDHRKPMHRGSLNRAIELIGYGGKHTAHGFRATARTILDEVLGYRIEWVEMQLAHEVRDSNGRAYNRTAFLPQRANMMQAWADYLDSLRITKKADNLSAP